MEDSSPSARDGSESNEESAAPTVSQSQFQGERLDQIEQLLTEDDGDRPDFATAVVAVFNIQCAEMELYLTVLEHPESTPSELAEILDGDSSAVNTRLKSLMEKDLVSRERRVNNKPGTTYEYTAKSLEETMKWMEEHIEGWSQGVVEELTTIRKQFPKNSQEKTA